MIRVGNNALSPDVAPATGTVSPQQKASTEAQILDQVELSQSVAAVPEDRSKVIAALKAAVASPGYLPPSLPVSRKLIAGALALTD